MTGLDNWLKLATKRLARESTARVRAEIREHYESAFEAAMADRATAEEAGQHALTTLGDPREANRQYRRVLLTAAEARLLGRGQREARALCARPWLRWVFLASPCVILVAAALLFLTGHPSAGRDALYFFLGMTPLLVGIFLPIHTPARSRAFRLWKWIAVTAAVLLIFGPRVWTMSWLWISCLWTLAWTEWMRASIRRKLPLKDWPRSLYL